MTLALAGLALLRGSGGRPSDRVMWPATAGPRPDKICARKVDLVDLFADCIKLSKVDEVREAPHKRTCDALPALFRWNYNLHMPV